MEPEAKATILIPLAIAVVSFAAILIRLCAMPTAIIAAYRLGFSSLILFPVFFSARRWVDIRRSEIGWCALSGLFLSLHFLFWIESLSLTTVASSVILVTTSPIFAALLARAFLGEMVSKRTMVAIVICFVGSLMITRGDISLERERLIGDIYALLGAAMAGSYFVTGRLTRRNLGHLEYAFLTYTASAIMLIAWALLKGDNLTGFASIDYLWVFLLAIGPQVFGHTSLNWALKYLPASRVTISILGEPVGSTLLAWLFFGEVPSVGVLIGGCLILYGVYLGLTERKQVVSA